MGKFNLIGVYRIQPTIESMSAAARYYHYDWLLDSQAEFKETVDWSAFENLALLEFRILGEFAPSEIDKIGQGDQAPYLEQYLDASGTKRLTQGEAIQNEGRRVCFFLHFLDVGLPVRVDRELIELPPIGELPDRLVSLISYVPPD